MEFLRAVGSRRSIRYFQRWVPVEQEKIQTMLEAARTAAAWGNVGALRKAVVIDKYRHPEALYKKAEETCWNQQQAVQAPVLIFWFADADGWDEQRDRLREQLDVGAMTATHGWSYKTVDEVAMAVSDFAPRAGKPFRGLDWELRVAVQETVQAATIAQLAAVDLGLGTCWQTINRDHWRETFDLPETVELVYGMCVGYPAERPEAGGQRPKPDFGSVYFDGEWGTPLHRDPKVVEEMKEKGVIQAPAPLPWRQDEIKALAAMFGLPT
jgi:nitroreductase